MARRRAARQWHTYVAPAPVKHRHKSRRTIVPKMKRHDEIEVGDIIRGDLGGWWTVNKIESEHGCRYFYARNALDNRGSGYLYGPDHVKREVL